MSAALPPIEVTNAFVPVPVVTTLVLASVASRAVFPTKPDTSKAIRTRMPQTQHRIMFTGSTGKSSIIKAFEDALLAFEDLAFGTPPRIRHLLPWCPGGDPVLGIALGRIINIMA